jgi:hypothetical protein
MVAVESKRASILPQPFFDPHKFFSFMNRGRGRGGRGGYNQPQGPPDYVVGIIS